MKSAIIAASLLSTLALSKPLEKRRMETSWEVETATVTVTGSAQGWGGWNGGNWGSWSKQTDAPAASSPAQASVTSAAPAQSSPAGSAPASTWSDWASSSTGAAPASNTQGLDDYASPILEQHNIHRANHSSPPLEWDDSLAATAAKIAATCVYDHNMDMDGGNYGQNIGAGAPGTDVPKMITNQMYNGEFDSYTAYGGEPVMDNFHAWGHFSQIVWADTTKLGCATQKCDGGLANAGSGVSPYFTVCNYKPAGNFAGEFSKNVKAPGGAATETV